jgi:hypothetical protein
LRTQAKPALLEFVDEFEVVALLVLVALAELEGPPKTPIMLESVTVARRIVDFISLSCSSWYG